MLLCYHWIPIYLLGYKTLGMEYFNAVSKNMIPPSNVNASIVAAGQVSARKLARAHILLLADQNRPQGASNDLIHQILKVSHRRYPGAKRHCFGLEAAVVPFGRPLNSMDTSVFKSRPLLGLCYISTV